MPSRAELTRFRALLRSVLLALLLTTSLVAAQAVAAPMERGRADVDWAALGYYYYGPDGQYFYIPTNGELWAARRITNTASGWTFEHATPEVYSGKVLEAVWAKRCPAVEGQTVTLSRQVHLPGTVGTLRASLKTLVFDTALHKGKSPFAWAELRLNGARLLRLDAKQTPLDTWVDVDVTSLAGEARHGGNTLTVVAKKKKTKKIWNFCSGKKPDFGVAAELYGLPRSELSATIPSGSFDRSIKATITNAGPSTVTGGPAAGQFTWQSTQPTGAARIIDVLGQSTSTTCTKTQTSDGFFVSCPLPEMAPDETITVDIYMLFENATCPGDWRIPYGFQVSGRWNEDNRTDNGSSVRYISCSPQRGTSTTTRR